MQAELKQPFDAKVLLRVKYRSAVALAVVSAVFCLTLVVLMTAALGRLRSDPPLDAAVIERMRQSIQATTTNDVLRSDFRTLDSLARRAHFAGLRAFRAGAFLLLGGCVVLVFSWKYTLVLKAEVPRPDRYPALGGMGDPLAPNRFSVAAFGLALLVFAAVAASLLRREGATGDGALAPAAGTGFADREEMARNWPNLRGPDGLGVAPHADPPTAWDGQTGSNILWKVALPRGGFNSPIVWGNKICLTGADGTSREIYGLDADSGDLLWTHRAEGIPGAPSRLPEVTDDTGYAAATMATDGERFYAVFATGELLALDAEGNRVWARCLPEPQNPYGHASSLITYENLLLVQYDQEENGRLFAIEGTTGRTVWEQKRFEQPCWASPVIVRSGGGDRLVANGHPYIVGYDLPSGDELWRAELMEGEVAVSPAAVDGTVFVGNEYARLVALGADKGGDPVWETDEDLPEVASPVAAGRYLVVATGYGVVTCRDTGTGDVLWLQEFDEGFYSSPVVAAGRVYLADMAGVTHVFKAGATYEPIGRSPLGEPVMATPACVGKRLYLRGSTHLFCIGEG